MKCRQHQSPLPLVCFTLAGQQPFPQDAFRFLECAAFGERCDPGDEDIPDVVRMNRNEHLAVQHSEGDEVPVTQMQILQKPKGIPAKSDECSREGTIGSRRPTNLQDGWNLNAVWSVCYLHRRCEGD